MAISSTESFLALLKKSNLLTAEQLERARNAAKGIDDAETLARALARDDLLSRWQAGQLLAGRSSFFLGKYKLIGLLGRGGMGGVFLAEHITMNRRVALKIVSKKVGKDPASLERFISEARAIAALDHPNIVQAYSIDNEGDRYYIVMEYVEGRDLKEIVERDGPLDFSLAADCIRQACDGLAHAHGRGMIHCDIKPSNLMVNQQGVVKILDMGLARLTGDDVSAGVKEDRVLGTVDYLAPEQAMESHDFDHRADIYSLGCTLYFLLTGRPPFAEGTLHQRIIKHQTQEPPSIVDHRPDTPDDLVEICQKMMAKDPDDRFGSAEEIGRLLAGWRPPRRKLVRATPLPAVDKNGVLAGVDVSGSALSAKSADDATDGLLAEGRRRHIIMLAAAGALLAVVLIVGTIVALVVLPSAGKQNEITRSEVQGEPAEDEPDTPPKEADEEDVFSARPSVEGDTKPPEKPPAEKPPSAKPQAEKKPPSAKPQAEKKPPKKPPPKKKVEPFRGFAKAVELPKLGGKPLVLGQIHAVPDATVPDATVPDATVIVKLVGGEAAIGARERFLTKRRNTDDGKPGWLVQYEFAKSKNESKQTDVARLLFDKSQLTFQWLKEAAAVPADHLRNCMLEITAAGKTHLLRLANPLPVAPIVVDLGDRKMRHMKRLLQFDWMPDTNTLRLEITKLEGPFPKHSFTPGKTIRAGDTMKIKMGEGNLPGVIFQVDFKATRTSIKIEVAPTYEMPDKHRFPLWKGEGRRLVKVVQELTIMEQQGNMRLSTIKDNAKKATLIKGLEAIKAKNTQYKKLGEFYKSINGTGKFLFRIFIEADGQQIDLVRTESK